MGLVFTQHSKDTPRTNTNKHYPKETESENIRANHLGFVKFLFQHYCQHLGLNPNHISAKSVFNFYVNKKIFSLLGTLVNTESAKKTFYRKLIQNTNLPTNHNFASIITEINKEIKHHTQQRYLITYASKDKKKLQTPAVTPRKIQLPTWKKTRVESPTNLSYHYTPGSTINILSTGTSTSNTTSAFGRFSFQKFTCQNLITKNPENPNLINQPDLSPIIVIYPPPVELIGQPPQQSHQQIQQPLVLLQQPPQPNLDPMAYALIAKLEKFTGEENNTQAWINDIAKTITANN
ncbi:hypothetical protein G9A89_015607 [Geosiphon pyriformis]|nr:hypothetical protein G9A89_015607 [Geosiphon pyriformis]